MLGILAVALAFLLSWQLTRLLAAGRGLVLLDHPNERSLHVIPTPRTGGLAIVAGVLTGQMVLIAGDGADSNVVAIGAAVAVVFAISVIDDMHSLSAAIRLAVQLFAGVILVAGGLVLGTVRIPGAAVELNDIAAGVVTVLGVTWMTNLYNFMDGMDGFAGGMGVIGFAAFAMLAWRGGDPALAARCAVVAGACLGFLLLNFPPARIFMGDSGSSVLGMLAAALALDADARGAFPLWLAVLVFSPFVVDATVTLLRRALAREAVWRAHRSHFYQRLVRLGWGHRRTVLSQYVLMVGCAITALGIQDAPSATQATALFAWAIAYTVFMVFVTHLERQGERW